VTWCFWRCFGCCEGHSAWLTPAKGKHIISTHTIFNPYRAGHLRWV